jgi:putative DNA primase/helicase
MSNYSSRALEIAADLKRDPKRLEALQTYGTYKGQEQSEEIIKSVQALLSGENNVVPLHEEKGITSFAFSSVTKEETRWLSKGRIPLGALTLLAGDGGLGKSMYTAFLSAATSNGKTSGELSGEATDVVFISTEDHASTTIRPRLEAASANLQRIHGITTGREGSAAAIQLPHDVAELERIVVKHNAKLLVLDPLIALLPTSVNSNNNQHVRRALNPLMDMAAKHDVAVVAVLHLTKGEGTDLMKRIGGSQGFWAAARSVMFLGRNPADPKGNTRIVSHEKCNLGEVSSTQLFQFEDEGTSSRIVLKGDSPFVAADSLELGSSPQEVERRLLAVKFLREELEMQGSVSAGDLRKASIPLGLQESDLAFARKETGATFFKEIPSGKWMLHMPDSSVE